MSETEFRWQAYYIYTSDLERLILECVHPFFERNGGDLELRYWQRHYAGGPHLRIRLCGVPDALERLGTELVRSAESFLAENPSSDIRGYSERRAAALLRAEGIEGTPPEELVYRNNVVEKQAYPPLRDAFVSRDAAHLMDEFRHDSMDLAHRILVDDQPRREILLRMYFLQALVVGKDLPSGSVSSRSHWEGFAATFASKAVIEAIRETYEKNRDEINRTMLEVVSAYTAGSLDSDPLLAAWHDILSKYRARARRELAAGRRFTEQPADLEEAVRSREETHAVLLRDSSFVRTFWADEVFAATIQFEPRMLVPRVLTNLLYDLVAMAGLRPIDKFSLCHFAFRAVEEHYSCDLQSILESNIARMKNLHGHRFELGSEREHRAVR